ncbi:MAG: hypothetical protein AB2A00_21660, partial [Myxococcota bacterium]
MTRLLLVLALGALCSCATLGGTMPAPPTDADLAHDGSVKARQELFSRYAITEPEGPHFGLNEPTFSVGDAVRPASHPEMLRYLRSDPSAGQELPPTHAIWASRILTGVTAVGLALVVAAILFSFTGVGALLAVPGLPIALIGGVSGALLSTWLKYRFTVAAVAYNEGLKQRIESAGPRAPAAPTRKPAPPPPPAPAESAPP